MRGFFVAVKFIGHTRSNWRGSVSLHAQLGPKYLEIVKEFRIALGDAFGILNGDRIASSKPHKGRGHSNPVIAVRLNHDV